MNLMVMCYNFCESKIPEPCTSVIMDWIVLLIFILVSMVTMAPSFFFGGGGREGSQVSAGRKRYTKYQFQILQLFFKNIHLS
jgi:hypothetical protein